MAGKDFFKRLGFRIRRRIFGNLRKAGDLWARHADEVTVWIICEIGSIPPKANFEIHMATTECYEASPLPSYP